MMKQIDFEKLNTVMRLFTVYTEQGARKTDAMSKTESKLGSKYSQEFGLIRDIFSESNESAVTINRSGNSFFQSLKLDTESSGGDSSNVLLEVSKLMRITSGGFKACSRFYQSIYTYPIIIMVVAMLIYTQYKLFVFDSMKSVFNSELPKLTESVFSDASAVTMLLVVALIVVFFAASIITLKRDFVLFRPNNSWFSRTLFCADDHSYLLFLLYFKTLLNCNSNALQAFEKSKLYAGISSSSGASGYTNRSDVLNAICSENQDIISVEVDFQLRSVVNEMPEKLISKQEKALAFFQTLIFVFVGTMIIAMYLPIFKLAAAFS